MASSPAPGLLCRWDVDVFKDVADSGKKRFISTNALNMTDCDEGGEFDGTQDEPRYLLLAREAEMDQVGGYNLAADPQRAGDLFTEAAEAAMAAMTGRLANQCYMKAEEAWALMEE